MCTCDRHEFGISSERFQSARYPFAVYQIEHLLLERGLGFAILDPEWELDTLFRAGLDSYQLVQSLIERRVKHGNQGVLKLIGVNGEAFCKPAILSIGTK